MTAEASLLAGSTFAWCLGMPQRLHMTCVQNDHLERLEFLWLQQLRQSHVAHSSISPMSSTTLMLFRVWILRVVCPHCNIVVESDQVHVDLRLRQRSPSQSFGCFQILSIVFRVLLRSLDRPFVFLSSILPAAYLEAAESSWYWRPCMRVNPSLVTDKTVEISQVLHQTKSRRLDQ